MFSFSGGTSASLGKDIDFFLALAVSIELFIYFGLASFFKEKLSFYSRLEPVFISFVLAICVYFRGPGSEFIYFQF